VHAECDIICQRWTWTPNAHRAGRLATAQFEKSPEQVQLYHGYLETMSTTLMEDIYQLSLTGANNDRKMRLVALEYRARLVPEPFRQAKTT
jgi:hypothetical protein